ncbi:hypothetical protein HYH03_005162 [Edaphochlamys debaryana]|uniref:Cyclic nucleotide-binding domain-containing protein n=1 Tax=Edaphochlamys debaryana TaxID=47281 RepID=A0A836C2J9_9CHLO|nr:hypothetical protein HYH03_005162 [Edaphochlamys debaryana]|eukprot:KAG2496753.1 hypothetical protein HYH03_005162 [Edaphochlamys debaryana]
MDSESPSPSVVSIKSLMSRVLAQLDDLRMQQDTLLRQFADQRRDDEQHQSWVVQRLEALDRAVQETASVASASAASAASAAAAATNASNGANAAAAAASALAAAASVSPRQSLTATAAGMGSITKVASFEFSRHPNFRTSRIDSGGGMLGSDPLPNAPGHSRLGSTVGGANGPGGGSNSSLPQPPGALLAPTPARRTGGTRSGGGSPTRRPRAPSPPSSEDDSLLFTSEEDGRGSPSRASLAARARLQRAKSRKSSTSAIPPEAAGQGSGGAGPGAGDGAGGVGGLGLNPASPFAAHGAQQPVSVAAGMGLIGGTGRLGAASTAGPVAGPGAAVRAEAEAGAGSSSSDEEGGVGWERSSTRRQLLSQTQASGGVGPALGLAAGLLRTQQLRQQLSRHQQQAEWGAAGGAAPQRQGSTPRQRASSAAAVGPLGGLDDPLPSLSIPDVLLSRDSTRDPSPPGAGPWSGPEEADDPGPGPDPSGRSLRHWSSAGHGSSGGGGAGAEAGSLAGSGAGRSSLLHSVSEREARQPHHPHTAAGTPAESSGHGHPHSHPHAHRHHHHHSHAQHPFFSHSHPHAPSHGSGHHRPQTLARGSYQPTFGLSGRTTGQGSAGVSYSGAAAQGGGGFGGYGGGGGAMNGYPHAGVAGSGRQTSTGEELPAALLAAAASHPGGGGGGLSVVPSSPRAGFTSGEERSGGGLWSPILGSGGGGGRGDGGPGGGGGAPSIGLAPSLARESLRSPSMTDRTTTDRVETASVKHFAGIPPRLVEIYRQRAETSRWALLHEPALQRVASRRGSTDMPRPTGLLRQSVLAGAGAGAVEEADGGRQLSRIALLHGAGGGKGGQSHEGGGGGGGKGGPVDPYDEASAFAIPDTVTDTRMIGDDDEYDRPMSLRERLRLYAVGLIRPEGRTRWDLFILVLLAWVLFASPVIICFGLQGDVLQGDWLGIVELGVDLAFAVDIYLNFRTAYYDSKGHLVADRWRIARHYLKTWFVLDVICVIPYDLITAGTMGFLSMLKLLRVIRVGKVIRMIKMYRLLRVVRLPRILERMEMYIDRGVLQVMAFILSVGLLAHLSACVFFYMAYLDGLGPHTWVAAYGVQDADLATRYLTSLYWAFTTTATVGYGDITPKTSKEKVIAIFVMCLGVSLVGYVTSSISNIMAIKNAQQTAIACRKQLVADVLKGRTVPSELSRRVYNFFDYTSTKIIKKEEAALLAELPFKLRSRMLQAFHADMLSRIPAIGRLPPHVLIELVSQLKPHYFVEGDIVTMQGDYVDALYIVAEGLLEVRTYMFPADVEPWRIFEAVHKDELRYMPYTAEGRLKPRYLFGQAGVMHAGVWPATVIARNCCELYALDREGLEHMLSVQPELQEMLGIPKEPIPACTAHAAFLSGPGANPLLPPADRTVLAADFPFMDPAPQRSLIQSMWRSVGTRLSGGLARASAAHYPRLAGEGVYGMHTMEGGGGRGAGSLVHRSSGSVLGPGGKGRPGSVELGRSSAGLGRSSVGLGRSSIGHGGSAEAGGGGAGGGGEGAGAGAAEAAHESAFSRFRPMSLFRNSLSGSRRGGGGGGADGGTAPETSRLLNGDRSDSAHGQV